MGMNYNKFVSKDRRNDSANRPSTQAVTDLPPDSFLIEELRAQVKYLRAKLENGVSIGSSGLYTAEQVNAEVSEAIKSETSSLIAENKALMDENKKLLVALKKSKLNMN